MGTSSGSTSSAAESKSDESHPLPSAFPKKISHVDDWVSIYHDTAQDDEGPSLIPENKHIPTAKFTEDFTKSSKSFKTAAKVNILLRHVDSFHILESTLLDDKDKPAHLERVIAEISFESGRPLQIELTLNKEFIASNYVLINATKDAKNLKEVWQATDGKRRPENCYYKGRIKNEPESLVALSTCKGYEGVIHTGQGHVFEMWSENTGNTNAAEDLRVKIGLVEISDDYRNTASKAIYECASKHAKKRAVKQEQGDEALAIESGSGLKPIKATAQTGRRVARLMIVSDYDNVQEWNSMVEEAVIKIINYASVLHQDLLPNSPLITLAGIYLSSDAPHFAPTQNGSVDADQILTDFCKWRLQAYLDPALEGTLFRNNDVAHLFTSRILYTRGVSIAGYANLDALCTIEACGVEYIPFAPNYAFFATILAHELGHNLGASHDGNNNTCPTSGYIMQPAFCANCGTPTRLWSNCSRVYVNETIEQKNMDCLPTSYSLCGNAEVDAGEQCDGGDTVMGSKCCTNDCKLLPNNACDDNNGYCCSNCQLSANGTQCRSKFVGGARESCDKTDFCNGKSARCVDTYYNNGTSCYTDPIDRVNSAGYCNSGICLNRRDLCWDSGFDYSATCNKGAQLPCLLYCLVGKNCVKLSIASGSGSSGANGSSAPVQYLLVPDYNECYGKSGTIGRCLAGKCISNGIEIFGSAGRLWGGTVSPSYLLAAVVVISISWYRWLMIL